MSRVKNGENPYENGYDTRKETFYEVYVFGIPMLFSCARLKPDTVPPGLHLYEVEYKEGECGNPYRIGKSVRCNYWGALLTKDPIKIPKNDSFRMIKDESEWEYTGEELQVKAYINSSQKKE